MDGEGVCAVVETVFIWRAVNYFIDKLCCGGGGRCCGGCGGCGGHHGSNQAPPAQAPPSMPPYGPPSGGYAPYGQPPYGQPPYGQPPYGYPPYGQPAYGYPPYGQPPQGQAPYPPPPGQNAPGGPAKDSEKILGNSNVHEFDDNNKNAQNPHYKELRRQAQSEGSKMAHAFDASKKAYASGQGARAKQLSEEGHRHQAEMERLNAEARQWIFAANNADSPPDTLDLHGLYVKEALAKVEEAVQKAQQQNYPQLKLIVGKGIHSRDHVSHVKPAVQRLLSHYHLDAHVDPHNKGIVVVNLRGPMGGGSTDFTHAMARGASGNEHECIIM